MSALEKVQPSQIELKRASFHVFESGEDGLHLAKSRAPLTHGTAAQPANFQRFEQYFQELTVEAAQEDPKTQSAQFVGRGPESVCGWLDGLFETPDDPRLFHRTSVQLAELLFQSLAGAAKRPAYFILAQFYAVGELCYGILKLDHDEHLEVDLSPAAGPPRVLVHQRDLPTASRLKDKFAFVLPPGQRRKYDLLVTDRKYEKRKYEQKVARFFLEAFLGAKFVEDSAFLTSQFIDVVRGFARKKRQDFDQKGVRRDLYYSGLEHFVCRDRISLTDFLDNALPEPEQSALRQDLHEELRQAGVTRSFRVDRSSAKAQIAWRRIVLSNQISITGEREMMNRWMTVAQEGAGYRFEIEAPSYVEN